MTGFNANRFPIDGERLTGFAQELVRCQSWNPPGDEAAMAALVARQLTAFGMQAETISVTPTRHNVIGRLPGKSRQKGTLLFVGHLDTVPPGNAAWAHDPLGAQIEAGRLYGRGSSDMKSGLAAAVFALGALAQSRQPLDGDIVFAGTVGEEVDCLGAKALLKSGILEGVSGMVIPEFTALELVTGHKGALWVRIETVGRGAHGSRPDLGVNAILHMMETIPALAGCIDAGMQHPLLGSPTINVATIEGGTKTNMVPDRCAITVDLRTLPGQSHHALVNKIRDAMQLVGLKLGGYQANIEVINDRAAVSTPVDHPFVQLARQTGQALWRREMQPQGVTYYTDASVFSLETAAPIIILGPGEGDQGHQSDEYVVVEKILQAAQFYAHFAAQWLTG